MPQANFNHAKHQVDPVTQKPLDCNICHQATESRETSDVLMQAKENCTTCHSLQRKVVAECITCHTYHAPIAAQTTAAAAGSVKANVARTEIAAEMPNPKLQATKKL